jgi:hypothetical protein
LFLTVSSDSGEPAPKHHKLSGRQGAPKIAIFFIFYFSKTMFVAHFLLDTRPASIPSSEDTNDDIIRPAEKGRPKNGAPKGKQKNGAEPSESGDESRSHPTSEDSQDGSSSDEDLTAMGRETV